MKNELLLFIQTLTEDQYGRLRFITNETLISGQSNKRIVYMQRQRIVDIINNNFNDDLIGHFNEQYITQINGWYKINEEILD